MLAVALAVTACSGDAESEPAAGASTSAEPQPYEPPRLEAAWTSSSTSSRLAVPASAGGVTVWSDGLTVSLVDPATGDETWSANRPGGYRVCRAVPSADGAVVGVLLGDRDHDCTVAGALDAADGSVLWSRELRGPRRYFTGDDLTVGRTTMAVELFCSEVRLLRLRDGRPVTTLAPRDVSCAMEAAADENVVFVLNDPATADTPDDLGTGWIPPHDSEGAFELYDADTGDLLWRRVLATTRGTGVVAVTASTRTTRGVRTTLTYREDGHTLTRTFDERGRPGHYVGRRQGTVVYAGPTVLGEQDGVLVLRYDGGADAVTAGVAGPILGIDAATGEELWAIGHTGPATVTETGLVLAETGLVHGEQQVWLTRTDVRAPAAPADREALGSVPGLGLRFLDDLLLATGPTAAYATDVEPGELVTTMVAAQDAEREVAWADDDLRPADVDLACEAVTPATQRLAGVYHRDLPPTADCTWQDVGDPDYLEQQLKVSVTAHAPGLGQAGESGTAEEAAAAFASSVDGAEPIDLPGLGQEAWAVRPASEYDGEPSVRLLVRWHNVVVDVTALQEIQVDDTRYASVPPDQIDAAALAAVGDVLAVLGAPSKDRVVPATPTVDAVVPDVCRTLADDGAAFTGITREPDATGLRASGQTPAGQTRQSACLWWGSDDAPSMEAMVHVVPASPLGLTPVQNARRLMRGGFADTEPVAGLGGRADFFRYEGGEGYRSTTLYGIVGHVLVEVGVTDPTGGLTRAEADALVVRMARELVRSTR